MTPSCPLRCRLAPVAVAVLLLVAALGGGCGRESEPAPPAVFRPAPSELAQQPPGEGRMDLDEFWRLIEESRTPRKARVGGVTQASGYQFQREAVIAAYRALEGSFIEPPPSQPTPSVGVDSQGELVTAGNDRSIEILLERESNREAPFEPLPGQETECFQAQALLVALVAGYSPEEILTFARFAEWIDLRLYTWPVKGAAQICLNDDSSRAFSAFRSWLLAQGRATCATALTDPDSLASLVPDQPPPRAPRFRLVPVLAYQIKSGRPLPTGPFPLPTDPAGEPWFDAELASLFPKLWARYR